MATTAKRQKMIEKADRMMKGVEMKLNPDNYRSDLIGALNYYNSNHDDKDKKKWLVHHIAQTDKKLAVALLKVDEYQFRYAGILARLMDGGSVLEEKEYNYFKARLDFLKDQVSIRQKSQDAQDKKDAAKAFAASASNVVSIQQRMEDTARKWAAEIDGAIDDFVLSKCKSDFSTKNLLLSNNVSGPIAKRIGEFYVSTLNEIREAHAGTDEQLTEGYSNFTKRELKKFGDFVEQIIADCNQMVQTAKVNRAPRKRKPVSPVKLASKMKFLREFTELNLKSVRPDTIVGATEAWVYNTKTRRISVYRGDLTVKGTSIVGFELSNSTQMTVRKPEEFFKGLAMGKRAMTNALKTITTKASTPNGRTSEDTIILGAF
jgi:hypothetical protein